MNSLPVDCAVHGSTGNYLLIDGSWYLYTRYNIIKVDDDDVRCLLNAIKYERSKNASSIEN